MLDKLTSALTSGSTQEGSYDPQTAAARTTPWAWRNADACYVGWNGQVWLYRVLPTSPMTWEDPHRRLAYSQSLHRLLLELGGTSRDVAGSGVAALVKEREVHLVAVTHQTLPLPPDGTPRALAEYQEAALQFHVPRRLLFVGVRLWGSTEPRQRRRRGKLRQAAALLNADLVRAIGEHVPDLSPFRVDRDEVHAMAVRAGGRVPTRDELDQLQSWYNLGRGTDEVVVDTPRMLHIGDSDRIEMSVVKRFDEAEMESPYSLWALDAMSGAAPASVVSIRAHLQPSQRGIRRLRATERRWLSTLREEEATGDVGRPEDEQALRMARNVEEYLGRRKEPVLTRASIVLGRRAGVEEPHTFHHTLRQLHDIVAEPLPQRQLEALAETLPTSSTRVNPFVQDLFPAMISHSGLQGFANLGDNRGVFLGLNDPDLTPHYLDVDGALTSDVPAGMAIMGDSGSGKAQPLDARLLRPDGSWTTMGEVAVGDELVGRDGHPTRVTGVYDRGARTVCRVTLDDGSSTRACDEHLWTVLLPDGSRRTLTTGELRTLVDQLGPGQVRLPPIAPPRHPAATLDDDPEEAGVALSRGDAGADVRARAFVAGSPVQRRRLVAACLDSAGDPDGAGAIIVDLPSGHADALADAVRSLGGAAQRDPRGAGTSGLVRVRVHGPVGEPIVRAHPNPAALRPTTGRTVDAVEDDGVEPTRCVRVDASDRLYVTDDYIPTHNTWLCQSIATQATLEGRAVIFIQPKTSDSRDPMAQLLRQLGHHAQTVRISQLESGGGYFDPFRYAEPTLAAEIAGEHILRVLTELTERQELLLTEGLKDGALAGARCVGEALTHVADDEVRQRVRQQTRASSLFSLAIADQPQPRFAAQRGLTLIEFDRPLALPKGGVTPRNRAERIGVATMHLLTRASIAMLDTSGGGVLIVDEAWTFLSNQEGLDAIDAIGREGRSQGLLPIFATQRIADLVGRDLESYLSRKVVLKLESAKEATAALRMLGIEPTEDRLRWLAQAKARRPSDDDPGRPAMGLVQDIQQRTAAVLFGPTPRAAQRAWSTNPADRETAANEPPADEPAGALDAHTGGASRDGHGAGGGDPDADGDADGATPPRPRGGWQLPRG